MQTISPIMTPSLYPRFEQPLKVIALGDSLVYGYGDPIGGGWVERLRRFWMEENGPVLYNLGIRGDRLAQVSERLEQEFRLRGELRNKVPDLLILSVGVNDSPRLGRPDGRAFTDPLLFEKQVNHLLTVAKGLCPVLFVGMVPVNEAKMPFLDCFYFNHADQYRYKEMIKQACGQAEIPYLDLFDLWQSRGLDWIHSHLMEDGLHPNVAGYKALLDDVLNWPALHQALQTADYSLERLN
ncbi:MAG: GDSL-type esterase/lipase family protein [Microcystaceae cyanobacterium]